MHHSKYLKQIKTSCQQFINISIMNQSKLFLILEIIMFTNRLNILYISQMCIFV